MQYYATILHHHLLFQINRFKSIDFVRYRRSERFLQDRLRVSQPNTILGPYRSCHTRLHIGKIQFERIGKNWRIRTNV